MENEITQNDDFFSFLIDKLSFADLVSLSETNQKFSNEIKSRIKELCILYEAPFVNSIQELGMSFWTSANRQLKEACSRGDRRMIELSLKHSAVKISEAAYQAAKHGHFDIMDQIISLDPNSSNIGYGIVKSGNLEEFTRFIDTFKLNKEHYDYAITSSPHKNNFISLFQGIDKAIIYNDNEKELYLEYGLPKDLWNYTSYNDDKFPNKFGEVMDSIIFSDDDVIKIQKTRFDNDLFMVTQPMRGRYRRLSDYVFFPDKTFKGRSFESMQYTFAKFLPDRFREISWDVIFPGAIMYCYKHNKNIDFMIEHYNRETERFIKIWHVFAAIYYLRWDLLDRLNFTPDMLTRVEAGFLAVKHPLIMKFLYPMIDIESAFYMALESDRPKMAMYLFDKLDPNKFLKHGIKGVILIGQSLECWKLFVPVVKTIDDEIPFIPSSLLFVRYLYKNGYLNGKQDLIRKNIQRYWSDSPIGIFLEEKFPNL